MRAVWYDRTGPAEDVLVLGELADPQPGPGELRVRVEAAGVNPRDVKRRGGVGDRVMTGARVIPGDDGAGVVDQVGAGVSAERIGQRVWVHSATVNRAFGTSADYVVVPAANAYELPADVPFEVGACLGVPALTAYRCVFADGPVDGLTVLVTGGSGAVGHYAVQLAKLGGATVIATASTPAKQQVAREAGADQVIDYRHGDVTAEIARAAGAAGVRRIIDVAFGANLAVTATVIAANGTIVSYASDAVPAPPFPFYELMRKSVTVRTVSVFGMPATALDQAAKALFDRLRERALTHPIAARFPLSECVDAHHRQESGDPIGKIILTLG